MLLQQPQQQQSTMMRSARSTAPTTAMMAIVTVAPRPEKSCHAAAAAAALGEAVREGVTEAVLEGVLVTEGVFEGLGDMPVLSVCVAVSDIVGVWVEVRDTVGVCEAENETVGVCVRVADSEMRRDDSGTKSPASALNCWRSAHATAGLGHVRTPENPETDSVWPGDVQVTVDLAPPGDCTVTWRDQLSPTATHVVRKQPDP